MTMETTMIHQWQRDVGLFHAEVCEEATPCQPIALRGELLSYRAGMIREEGVKELHEALEAESIRGVVDSLLDTWFVTLGTFDAAGAAASGRFGLLVETGVYRGFTGWTAPKKRFVGSLAHVTACLVESMEDAAARGDSFEVSRLNLINNEIAHTFCILGIDPRPLWPRLCANNLTKKGGPRRADGKRLKPPGYVKFDAELEQLLRAQGVAL